MVDKKFRVPRIWSNRELKKFAGLFDGRVVNVSAWKDIDKEGRKYRDYFENANEYWITNYKAEARGFQGGQDNELYLDLSVPLDEGFPVFDVVFNHTVLEHIFELDVAFQNICRLSKDIVILVVPFLQEQHADYGDYWRFTPQAIDKLFIKNEFEALYISANNHPDASIYVFAVVSRFPQKWARVATMDGNLVNVIYSEDGMIGRRVIENGIFGSAVGRLKEWIGL